MKKLTMLIIFIISCLLLSGCYKVNPLSTKKHEAVKISETEAPVRDVPIDSTTDDSLIFDEARINQGNGNVWTVKIDSYERWGSMFHITTDTGAAILVHEINCILYKYGE